MEWILQCQTNKYYLVDQTAVSTYICLRIQRSTVVSFKVPENLYALNRLEILYHFKLVIATLKESLQ